MKKAVRRLSSRTAFSLWLAIVVPFCSLYMIVLYIVLGACHDLTVQNFYSPFLGFLAGCLIFFPFCFWKAFTQARLSKSVAADGVTIDFRRGLVEFPYSKIKAIRLRRFLFIAYLEINRGIGHHVYDLVLFESKQEAEDFLTKGNLMPFVEKKK